MSQYTQFGAVDKLTVSAAAAANSVITATTHPRRVAVIGTVAFHAKIGATSPTPPAAANTDFYYPAGQIHIFDIPAGSEISFRGTGSGEVYVQQAVAVGD
jgi:hypothetical protein